MKGKCKLFGNECELRNSHIFPKFVIDYFKDTGSRFLRSFKDPNKRKQDGLKRYFLSEEAEQRFSLHEKWFAENMFKPYQKGEKQVFEYDEHLFYFAISFLWRILLLELEEKIKPSDPNFELLSSTEKEWRNFLSNYQYPMNYDQVFIWLTDGVKSHTIDAKGVDYFFTRQIDATWIYNDQGTYLAVYGKFLKFIFWSELKSETCPKRNDLLIHPSKGKIIVPQNFDDLMIGDFILNRIKETQNCISTSEKQQEKIKKEIKKDPDAFLNSDAGRAIINDFENLKP